VQDGMYLRHVEGHYSQGGGCTPLALLWKDESCSRYLLVSSRGLARHCSVGYAVWVRAVLWHATGTSGMQARQTLIRHRLEL
jgi:hypothetical protein